MNDEPLTPEIVLSLVPADRGHGKSGEGRYPFGRIDWQVFGGSPPRLSVWLNGEILPWRSMTAGQFRRLVAALGPDQ